MTITENYFKARGWVPGEHEIYGSGWKVPLDTGKGTMMFSMKLPSICESFPDFKKFVLEPMEGEGLTMWFNSRSLKWVNGICKVVSKDPIQDNEILEAAVVAATRYFKEKK